MKTSAKTRFLYIFLFVSLLAQSETRNQAYLLYIEQYHQLAQRQQKEHGIPASIVLAQGLLESGAGQSEFAKKSNNHFGIKCNDWAGETIYHDDDKKGECFRKYNQVLDSYEDHAIFLKSRSRYAFLFNLDSSDYEGWAYGLKKAGYATDPSYAYKLISIIDNYNLHQYDVSGGDNLPKVFLASKNSRIASEKRVTQGSMGAINAVVIHQLFRVNKVKFVTALPGDTYAGIADEFNMSEERLRIYNEVNSSSNLKVGTRVFLGFKKNKAPKENKTHTVQSGESIYSISQDYAIKIERIYKMNDMSFTEGPKLGQVLKLR